MFLLDSDCPSVSYRPGFTLLGKILGSILTSSSEQLPWAFSITSIAMRTKATLFLMSALGKGNYRSSHLSLLQFFEVC